MKYRDILVYSKPKKKVVKEQLKPKTNKVLKDSLSIPNNSYENKKSTKAKIKPKQQVIKDTGREIYIH